MALYREPTLIQCTCGNTFRSYGNTFRSYGVEVYPLFAPRKDACAECKARVKAEADAKHYAELDALPIEERIRRIEKWMYEFKFPAPTYVPPPTY